MWRFVITVLVLIGSFEILFATVLVSSAPFRAYLEWTGRISAALLGLLGHEVRVEGVRMIGNATIIVSPGCDGWQTAAMYCAALLGYPASWPQRAWGILAGSLVILAANLARVSSLYLVALHRPESFKMMHEIAWPIALMLLTMALWVSWVRAIAPRAKKVG